MTFFSTSPSAPDRSETTFALSHLFFGGGLTDNKHNAATFEHQHRRWSQHATAVRPSITADEAMNLSRATSHSRHASAVNGHEASIFTFATDGGSMNNNNADLSRGVSDSPSDLNSTRNNTSSRSPSPSRRTSRSIGTAVGQKRRTWSSGSGTRYQGIGLIAAYSGPSAF